VIVVDFLGGYSIYAIAMVDDYDNDYDDYYYYDDDDDDDDGWGTHLYILLSFDDYYIALDPKYVSI